MVNSEDICMGLHWGWRNGLSIIITSDYFSDYARKQTSNAFSNCPENFRDAPTDFVPGRTLPTPIVFMS